MLVSQLYSRLDRELDLEGETLLTFDNFIDYINDAIEDAEVLISQAFGDYFLVPDFELDIVAGQEYVDLPSDIYLSRIRYMSYSNGSESYKIKKKKLDRIQDTMASDGYTYRIENTSQGSKIKLYPTPSENVDGGIILSYLRKIDRVIDDNSVIECPYMNFIISHVKVSIFTLDDDTAKLQLEIPRLERYEKKLQDIVAEGSLDEEDVFLGPSRESMEDYNSFHGGM